jgi:hypothetical protein
MRYTPTLVLVIAFLIAIGITNGIYAFQQQSLFFAAICLLSLVSGLLLALRRAISRYPFFLLAALIMIWWLRTTLAIIEEGWPYMDPISSVISLIPGVLLISFCVVGSLYVYRISKRPAA